MKHVKLTRETVRAIDKLRAKNKAFRAQRESEAVRAAFDRDVERAAYSNIECRCGHPEKRHYLPGSNRACFVLESDRATYIQRQCPCGWFQLAQPFGEPKPTRTPRQPSKPKVVTIQEAISEPLTRLGKRKIDL